MVRNDNTFYTIQSKKYFDQVKLLIVKNSTNNKCIEEFN